MKKVLALLLILVCAFNASISCIFAASSVLKTEKDTYEYDFVEGETFTVDFILTNCIGVNNATFRVAYDPSVIQAVSNSAYSLDEFATYVNDDGDDAVLIPNSIINRQVAMVPKSQNEEFEGKADGSKTASELGYILLSNYISSSYIEGGSLALKGLEKEGKLFRMTFKMIAPGSTEVKVMRTATDIKYGSDLSVNKSPTVDNPKVDVSVQSGKVIIKKSNNNNTTKETTTEVTTHQTTTNKETETQTTTKKTTSQSSSSSSPSSTAKETTTQTTTNKEATTQTTTKTQVVTETTTESTTQAVKDNNENSSKSFKDIADYPWAVNAIEKLAEKKIISGIGNNMFGPSSNVKRADFLLMLMNALGINEGTAKSNFDDVDSSRYYANAVGLAKDLGIASGSGNNLFKPDENISRQDMMVLASKALAQVSPSSLKEDVNSSVLDKFEDKKDISNYAVESLSKMVEAGIVNGSGNKIDPKSFTTRAQSAVIIYNIYNAINK